jgi:hypothetical protein
MLSENINVTAPDAEAEPQEQQEQVATADGVEAVAITEEGAAADADNSAATGADAAAGRRTSLGPQRFTRSKVTNTLPSSAQVAEAFLLNIMCIYLLYFIFKKVFKLFECS